ncbi:hypothetical protein GMORB2_2458 [Geosmithia morbida]|uniref:Uncharacterized protein n=1 Tax=Geosmithia morbida TaxID=1094350 RepID=A0A9P4YR03_9HYPO|nr:uncharacterized protein GMORB2_2458 [Geosmithia morbida]KAF4120972.1 hypothetical protein GMORB2_2458 [Geosmithia morbida]
MSAYYSNDSRSRPPHGRADSPERPSSRDSYTRESMHLEPPPPSYRSSSRPRSVTPDGRELVARRRSSSIAYSDNYDDDDGTISVSRSTSYSRGGRDYDDGREDEADEDRMRQARKMVKNNFSNSTVGIGASLVGALAGGYVAREASERFAENRRRSGDSRGSKGSQGSRNRQNSETDKEEERIRLATTILGAAIGGLGANALTRRYENSRDVADIRQRAWDDSYGRDEGESSRYSADRKSSSRRSLEDRGRDDYYGNDYYDERPYDRRYADKRLHPS